LGTAVENQNSMQEEIRTDETREIHDTFQFRVCLHLSCLKKERLKYTKL